MIPERARTTAAGRLRAVEDEVGGDPGGGHGGRGGVAGELDGEHGGVDDAQAGDAADSELGVDDVVVIGSHGVGADAVVDAGAGVDGVPQYFLGCGDVCAGELLVEDIAG